ncbi:MAG: DNA polymerase Y family protein [Planctomycetota bacterium]
MVPCVMHVDIDAFFASVEQVRDPRLRGRPVIVGSGVIASCSYEAREFGLEAGMPLKQARRLCPEVVILEGHYPTYRCFADRIFALCHRFAPHVETFLDEAYCDLTGTGGLYGDVLHAGRQLKDAVRAETGLRVSVGIGANRMVAKMAGGFGKPDGLVLVEHGDEETFIRDLPVRKLPGIGRARLDTLGKLNIATIGELQQLDRPTLEALFGGDGDALYERCRGRDSRVIAEREIPKSISRETAFHEDTADPHAAEAMHFYLTERASRVLRRLGLQARTIEVRIRYADGKAGRTSRSLPAPTDLDDQLFAPARDLLAALHRRRTSLHRVGVRLARFSMTSQHQRDLFAAADVEKRASLYACLDRLRDRFGHSAIVAGKYLGTLGSLRKDRHGYVLRTPCLTK